MKFTIGWLKEHLDTKKKDSELIDKLTDLDKKINAKMLLQIHDELVFESTVNDQKNNEKLIKKAMTSVSSSEHHMFSIPLEVSVNSGYNWGEAH